MRKLKLFFQCSFGKLCTVFRELSKPVSEGDQSAEGKARLYYQTCIAAQNQVCILCKLKTKHW